ncbi:MAG: transporter substrate-binding domain-containing protein [Ruminococcaceae bacterium]|nr:transporter substrate-binding domain-containing protein [Oscillospiraceae bacterium]
MKKLLSLVLAAIMLCGAAVAFSSCADNTPSVKIGVQQGTTGEAFLIGNADMGYEKYENVNAQSYENGALAVQDLISGKIDYVVIDNAVAADLVKNNADIKMIDYALTKEDYGIGVDKNQKELLNSINKILKEKKAEIDAIYASYAENSGNDDGVDENEWTGNKIVSAKFDADKKETQLVVATNAAFAPYEFKVGTAFAGIDMEIAKLIADELQLELVIQHMDFDSVVTSIGKNGVDIALAGLTINPAREKVVDFSDPYEEGVYQVIIAKKDNTTFDSCKSAEDVLAVLKDLK